MRAKSSKSEPTTEPRTYPSMTPTWRVQDDDAPLIGDKEVDDGGIEDDTEGSRNGGVEVVVGGGVVKSRGGGCQCSRRYRRNGCRVSQG
jgi:hypothetical protein